MKERKLSIGWLLLFLMALVCTWGMVEVLTFVARVLMRVPVGGQI